MKWSESKQKLVLVDETAIEKELLEKIFYKHRKGLPRLGVESWGKAACLNLAKIIKR